ncbi:MAG: DUF2071 domain-containing protein [Chthoniobacteraceae bacterium]
MSRVFLTAEWRSLVMLNYEIDPKVLAPLIPAGTELDLWEGRAVISVVGFLFLNTRLLGIPIPWHRDFPEVNLRFYVRRLIDGEWRRGVTFIREIVPRRAIAAIARCIYNEPYIPCPMGYRIDRGEFDFSWRHRGRWQRLGVAVKGDARPMRFGSEEEFIFEHYWGYTRQRDGGTIEYAVEHPRWRVWSVQRSWLDCDVGSLFGEPFVKSLTRPPRSAFVAEGSPVLVTRPARIPT